MFDLEQDAQQICSVVTHCVCSIDPVDVFLVLRDVVVFWSHASGDCSKTIQLHSNSCSMRKSDYH